MFMTGELGAILVVLGLVALVLVALIKEWSSPDIVAMAAFCFLVIAGVLPLKNAYSVFSNPAPITIAAMFILSAALEKTGLIDTLGHILNRLVGRHLWFTLPALMLLVAGCSAFINNTPVVVVFLPVVLAICRRKHVAASKLLIPLSYAAVLGGCCTLIGTSTNILVSGIATEYHQPPLEMFEFAPLGVILLGVGILYVTIFGPWRLPDRQSISAILGPQDRQQFLCHVLVKPHSPLVGRKLTETELADLTAGFRILEVRRGGARLTLPLDKIEINGYDRILLSVTSRKMERAGPGIETLKTEVAEKFGIENLSTIKGAIVEGIVAPHSHLIGKSLKSSRFRQTFGMLVLAVHRQGKNLARAFQNAPLQFGDTVLMLGPLSTFDQMREDGDFMLLEDQTPVRGSRWRGFCALAALAAVVVVVALNLTPIVFAATAACVVVLWLRCLSPQEAYKSIDWTIIFMLYGMLAIGNAMETTGAAAWVAHSVVHAAQNLLPKPWLPYVVLSLFYFLGSMLTEVLSNNATAVVLAPIAINSAIKLGLDPRPFIFAVAFSSSAAFSTPIGYQTHMMIYGAGGYRFSDFVKFGLPLNILLWAVATWYIPRIWPF